MVEGGEGEDGGRGGGSLGTAEPLVGTRPGVQRGFPQRLHSQQTVH